MSTTDVSRVGASALLMAAAAGDTQAVEQLLNAASPGVRAAFVSAADQDNNTALHLAAENGHETVVGVLLSARAAVDSADAEGFTPLLSAAARGHAGVAKVLLEAGASVHIFPGQNSPLHVAADSGHANVVKLLLQAGASTDSVGAQGRDSPLAKAACQAALHGGLDTIDCFLDHFSTSAPGGVVTSVDNLVLAAVAAAEVANSEAPEDQKAVLSKLLSTAGKEDGAATNAALQQHFPQDRPAGALLAGVFMDAMLEASARVADIRAQKTAVQHLFLAVMAPHATGKKKQEAAAVDVEGVEAGNEPAGSM
jgi:ankyrin repeat protein